MICPVDLAGDVSAFEAVRAGDHGEHGLLLEGRGGAGDEGTGSDLASHGEEDQLVAGGGDPRHQRPADAALAGALPGVRLGRAVRPAAGQPSPKRVPMDTVEKVLGLYRERYFDFNVQHFHEKLKQEHGIELSYTWVKLALQGAGLGQAGPEAGESIASGASGDRCRACCCTWTGAITSGFRTSAGTTCWPSWTTPAARSTTRSWWKRNQPRR